MSTVVAKMEYTPEDLLTMPDGERYELVDGHLVETAMGARASYIAANCIFLVKRFVEGKPSGWVLESEGSYQCFPDAPTKVRRPDVSFIRFGRLPNEDLPDGHIRIAPDLAAEVISPNDLAYSVEVKLNDWLSAGVGLVWFIYPDVRTVRVHRADGTAAYLTEQQELTGDDVLPGFRCPVRELFQHPARQ